MFLSNSELISPDHIEEIPKKYNISRICLSMLLGWGKKTFTLYCKGKIPTDEHSVILSQIYESPSYYLYILERNKDLMASPDMYRISRECALELLDDYTESR